ncbi:recombinase family protein [Variovorax sp. GB1P17]|uniref:recombinase family protein n=1 Tax=Variovorax sp. GB1P17 TaxID=3443740 RepID=UPI003F44FF5F
MLVGYARVSTSEQETHLQIDALKRYGVHRIHREKGSGVGPRPELQSLLASLVEGDTLVVWKLDRIARSMTEVMRVMDLLKQRGCSFKSLTEPIDTSHSFGELTLQMIAAFAQFERSLIRERAIAGQVSAWRRGVRWGGQPRVVTDEDARELVRLKETGYFTIAMLADAFNCSESTVWRTYWLAKKPSAGKLRKRGAPVLSQYL